MDGNFGSRIKQNPWFPILRTDLAQRVEVSYEPPAS
jgi:hypothetical protein